MDQNNSEYGQFLRSAGDSCISQLLSITNDIYKSFDNGFDVRGVFRDIPKAFDKVWHKGKTK